MAGDCLEIMTMRCTFYPSTLPPPVRPYNTTCLTSAESGPQGVSKRAMQYFAGNGYFAGSRPNSIHPFQESLKCLGLRQEVR
ncbi:uncharacterized protein PG986_009206 [Apiospora aurea]|uniref:Uncharacterized protein n=1 Tax=Apiospora aurea TaxID=335848 RepID=A0ABR1Q739_9PEZI